MKNFITNIITPALVASFLMFFSIAESKAQCSASSVTPTTTSACTSLSSYTTFSGSSPCTGSGFGGSGSYKIIPICTNAAADCFVMDFTGLPGTNGVSAALYTTCTGTSTYSGYVSGSVNCYSTTTQAIFSTASLGLTPNTCYYLRLWSKDGFPAGSQYCAYTNTPANDECVGATGIDATPQTTDNYCMTSSALDPTPASFCAASLENTAWYTFTVQNNGDVVITINNISCSGGGSGFQIGFFSGSCASLTNDGCTTGSGGSVTATYAAQTAGTKLYIGLDGNAGAYCKYDISATNTVPLPIELLTFDAKFDAKNLKVDLNWSTATEINNDYFTIERTTDGVHFEAIGIVDGSGTSTFVKDYSAKDNNPELNTTVYYRLTQTDFDGKKTESALVSVKTNTIDKLVILPNPVIGDAQIKFTGFSNQDIYIKVYDVLGNLATSALTHVVEGENVIELPTNGFSDGVYLLFISDENNRIISQTKLFKQ